MLGMLLYVTVGLILVLACRKPARWLFGAGPAFSLWLLPPALAMLPWLPALPAAWTFAPTLLVGAAASTWAAQAGPDPSSLHWPLLLWLAGTLVCLLRLMLQYSRLLRQGSALPDSMLRRLAVDPGGMDPRRLRLHRAGPAVLWARAA